MRGRQGFTLVEMICVLLLIGVLGTGLTAGFTFFARQQQIVRRNYQQAQRIQVALARIAYEVKNGSSLSVAANKASYTLGNARSFYLSGSRLILNVAGTEHVLTDNVQSLSVNYASNLVNVSFVTTLADNSTASTSVSLYK